MDRVVVLRAKRRELVVVMLSADGLRAEMVHVDEAEISAAGDAAAVVIAERDAAAGGLGRRAELEAAVRRNRPHEPAGALRAEELGDGLGDRAHMGRIAVLSDTFVDAAEPDDLRVAGRALSRRRWDLDRVRARLTPAAVTAHAHRQRHLIAGLDLVPPPQRDLAHRAEHLLVRSAWADSVAHGLARVAPLGVGLGLELEGYAPGREERVLSIGGLVPGLAARDQKFLDTPRDGSPPRPLGARAISHPNQSELEGALELRRRPKFARRLSSSAASRDPRRDMCHDQVTRLRPGDESVSKAPEDILPSFRLRREQAGTEERLRFDSRWRVHSHRLCGARNTQDERWEIWFAH